MLNESERIYQSPPQIDITPEQFREKGFKNLKSAVKFCYAWDDITSKINYKFANYRRKDKSKSWLGWDKERGCIYEKNNP